MLTFSYSGGNLILTWPASASEYVLQQTDTLTPPDWQNSSATVTREGDLLKAVISASTPATRFYRLFAP
jgi:hypothetical protein